MVFFSLEFFFFFIKPHEVSRTSQILISSIEISPVKLKPRAGEMVRWAQRLLCDPKKLSSLPPHLCKVRHVGVLSLISVIYSPSVLLPFGCVHCGFEESLEKLEAAWPHLSLCLSVCLSVRLTCVALVLSTQVEGPFKSNSIVLGNLKPYRVYCLQTEAQLILKNKKIRPHGLLSNVSCHETTANGRTYLHVSITCCKKGFS